MIYPSADPGEKHSCSWELVTGGGFLGRDASTGTVRGFGGAGDRRGGGRRRGDLGLDVGGAIREAGDRG